jgi:hypothetical protein
MMATTETDHGFYLKQLWPTGQWVGKRWDRLTELQCTTEQVTDAMDEDEARAWLARRRAGLGDA